jgi:hypothetical protein
MRRRGSTFQAGLLAAVLAATLQFVVLAGSLAGVFSGSTASASLHAGQCGDAPGEHQHGDAACALCPVCLAATLPGVLPPTGPDVVPPVALAEFGARLPGGTQLLAARIFAAAYPRGPPLIGD